MRAIPASRANVYSGSPLDRMDNKRNDADWIATRIADPACRFLPTWRGRTLFTGIGPDEASMLPRLSLLDRAAAEAAGWPERPWALLGVGADGAGLFAFEVAVPEASGGSGEAAPTLPVPGRWEDLRALAGLVPEAEAAIVAQARGLMHWRGRHAFCGNCGGSCEPRSAGWALACPRCGAQHFPRTDPAVIMLVQRAGAGPEADRALLGHSTRFPSTTMYSTLAGFVEPGESLEEAVRREVWEESGIRTGGVHYHSSQPWPFPGSIMLGFYAEALSEEITIDPTELRDARWFTRAELRDHAALGFSLPRADSIARRLIEDWIDQA